MRTSSDFFKYFFVLPLLALAIFVQTSIPAKKAKRNLMSPPTNLKYFTLGYNDLIASSLWIRVLQDFEYCEGGRFTESDFVKPLETEKDGVDKVLKRKMHDSKCNLGWVYTMLDSLTEIQPRFRLAYETGATFLSVVVDDREGARLIYEKGLKYYPDDWDLNFRAAYHYLWEIQDARRAAELFDKASKLGGPPWLVALSAALFTKVGKAQFAKIILEDALRNNPQGKGSDRIKVRLDEVNKILEEKP